MKSYEGHRAQGECVVMVTDRTLPHDKSQAGTVRRYRLPLYNEVVNHSPTGFEWGYTGSGPTQLALAILVDSLGRELALEHYHAFKTDFIAGLEKKGWRIEEIAIRRWLGQQARTA